MNEKNVLPVVAKIDNTAKMKELRDQLKALRGPKVRLVKLSDDTVQNVKLFACSRLNRAVSSIRVVGNCFGGNFSWTEGQIAILEKSLLDATKIAVENLRTGKKIADAGIRL